MPSRGRGRRGWQAAESGSRAGGSADARGNRFGATHSARRPPRVPSTQSESRFRATPRPSGPASLDRTSRREPPAKPGRIANPRAGRPTARRRIMPARRSSPRPALAEPAARGLCRPAHPLIHNALERWRSGFGKTEPPHDAARSRRRQKTRGGPPRGGAAPRTAAPPACTTRPGPGQPCRTSSS